MGCSNTPFRRPHRISRHPARNTRCLGALLLKLITAQVEGSPTRRNTSAALPMQARPQAAHTARLRQCTARPPTHRHQPPLHPWPQACQTPARVKLLISHDNLLPLPLCSQVNNTHTLSLSKGSACFVLALLPDAHANAHFKANKPLLG